MLKRTFVNLILVFAVLLTLGVSAVSAQEELTYTVKLGDNLWTLAEKYLGNGPAYHSIVAATNARSGEGFANIVDAGLIQPGLESSSSPAPRARRHRPHQWQARPSSSSPGCSAHLASRSSSSTRSSSLSRMSTG